MNQKRKKSRLLPGAIVLSIVVAVLMVATGAPPWLDGLFAALAGGVAGWHLS
jgi:ABC-type uncharacterized transport system permease subunit